MTHHFTLDIELREPMALTDGSSDGAGGHESLAYIPGTSILGACVGAFGITPTDPLFAQLFLDDCTRFLNAYPVLDGARTLPRPLTLRIGKLQPARVFDALEPSGSERTIEIQRAHFNLLGSPKDSIKAVRESFARESNLSITAKHTKQEQVHVGIDRATRAAQDGVLFTYESIPAGACFRSVISTTDERVAALLKSKTQFDLRLGRSRSAGYGMTKATLTHTSDWSECSSRNAAAQSAIVTLLADYMPHLESSPMSAFICELAAALGVAGNDITVRASATRMVRGFRGVWGLPRPARAALAKGSVVVVTKAIDATRLAKLSTDGIGARRNEGFGRVAVNWVTHGAKSEGNPDNVVTASSNKLARNSSTRGSAKLTSAIEARRTERRLRSFVDRALSNKLTQTVAKAFGKLPPSQLGNLRGAMASTMTQEEIATWFVRMSEKTAGERWKKATVPALREKDCKRNGLGFVWSSLFGGEADNHDKLANTKRVDWKAAVEHSLHPLVADDALRAAAVANFDRTLRLFVIGLCGEITRNRNLDKARTTAEGSR